MKFGLYLPCIMCGVIFSVALNLLYFLKKHIDVEETKIFSRLLVANLAGLFGEFIG